MEHLIDLDEDALDAARRRLRTSSPKDTVNAALRLVTAELGDEGRDVEGRDVDAALDVLAAVEFVDRVEAWR